MTLALKMNPDYEPRNVRGLWKLERAREQMLTYILQEEHSP